MRERESKTDVNINKCKRVIPYQLTSDLRLHVLDFLE